MGLAPDPERELAPVVVGLGAPVELVEGPLPEAPAEVEVTVTTGFEAELGLEPEPETEPGAVTAADPNN